MEKSRNNKPRAQTPRGIGSRIRETARHTAVFGLGGVLHQATSIILLPVYTRFLSVSDYGILNLILIVKPAISMLTSSMIGPSLFRSYYDYNDAENRSMVVSTSLYLALAISFGMFGLGYLFAGPLSLFLTGSADNSFLILLVLYTGALQSIQTVGMAVFRAMKKSAIYTIISVSGLILTLGITIYLVGVRQIGFSGVIYGNLAGRLLISLFILHMIRKELKPVFHLGEVRKIVSYGLPFIPLNGLTLLERSGTRIILQLIAGPSAVGIFALAYRLAQVIQTLVISPLKLIWPAAVFDAEKDPRAREFYSKLVTYYLLIASFLAAGITATIGDVLALVARQSYLSAVPVVPWTCLAIVLFGLQGYMSIGLMLKRKTFWFPLCTGLGLALSLALQILLVPLMGPPGAGLALAAGYALSSYVRYRAGQRFYRMEFEGKKIVKLVLTVTGIGLLGSWLPLAPSILSIAARGLLVSLGVPITLYLLGFFEERELAQVRMLAERLRLPVRHR